MEWSKKIFSVAGIPIKIHLSIGLLFLWILSQQQNHAQQGSEQEIAISAFLTFIFIMGSVTMHELAHALTAKQFGIRTRDITLYPFGGIALLQDRINATQELFITLAGPCSNLLVAILICVNSQLASVDLAQFLATPLGELFLINIVLGIFNLIPAYPMDGGRILRATLQILKVKKADLIASRTSQALCILLATVALLYGQYMLLVIAIFIFMNASKELLLAEAQLPASTLNAGNVMIALDKLLSLQPAYTLETAANFALKTAQTHFPVMLGEQFLGLVERDDILQKAVSSSDNAYITEIMLKNIPSCSEDLSLEETFKLLEEQFARVLLVTRAEVPVGLIFKDQLQSLLLIQQVFKQNSQQRELERDLGAI